MQATPQIHPEEEKRNELLNKHEENLFNIEIFFSKYIDSIHQLSDPGEILRKIILAITVIRDTVKHQAEMNYHEQFKINSALFPTSPMPIINQFGYLDSVGSSNNGYVDFHTYLYKREEAYGIRAISAMRAGPSFDFIASLFSISPNEDRTQHMLLALPPDDLINVVALGADKMMTRSGIMTFNQASEAQPVGGFHQHTTKYDRIVVQGSPDRGNF